MTLALSYSDQSRQRGHLAEVHPWLLFDAPVRRPAKATSGWAAGRPPEVGGVHHGLDLVAKVGDPVYAVGDGVIAYARRESETAGNWVGIRHADGMLTRYLHLSRIDVQLNQRVSRGQQIGLSGSTGFSSGPHLHFDVYLPEGSIPIYAAMFGTPRGGFGKLDGEFGRKVPAEPLIPVDWYDSDVTADAARYGIPLYHQVAPRRAVASSGKWVLFGGLALLVGAGVFVKTMFGGKAVAYR